MTTSLSGFQTPYDPMAAFKVPENPYLGSNDPNASLPNFSTGDGSTGGSPWYSGFLSSKDADGATTQGWGTPALGAASGLFNAWMGMKQYGLAKQQLAAGKQQFALNYDAQRTTTNAELADRQAARVASNPGAYTSVGDYMATNGIKPLPGG